MAYLYDPRVDSFVNTNNPAIIFADAVVRMGAVKPDRNFWDKIKILADFADSGNGNGSNINNIFNKELKKSDHKKIIQSDSKKIIELTKRGPKKGVKRSNETREKMKLAWKRRKEKSTLIQSTEK